MSKLVQIFTKNIYNTFDIKLTNHSLISATNNYVLPKGATVVITTLKIHRRPDIYPNPDVFNPDNFLPEKTQERHYYSFIPFSAGPRSCVGNKLIHFYYNITC